MTAWHRRLLVAALSAMLTITTGCSVLGDAFGPADPGEFFDAETVEILDAAADGDVGKVRALMAAGADIEALANDHDPRRAGITPLQWLVEFGSPRTISTLIDAGADPWLQTSGGYNAASYAVLRDKPKSLRALLDADPTLINAPDRSNYGTVLHTATLHDRTESIDLLLERGADLDATTSGGQTPIFTAAGMQNVALCLRYIRAGADGGHRDDRGETFLRSLYRADDDLRTGEFLRNRNRLERELRDRGFPVETGR